MLKTLYSIGTMIFGGQVRSPEWPAFRARFVHGKHCAACGTRKGLEAHHKLPLLFGGAELDEANLIALCRDCHFTFGHLRSWFSYNPKVEEDCASYLEKVTNRPRISSSEGWPVLPLECETDQAYCEDIQEPDQSHPL